MLEMPKFTRLTVSQRVRIAKTLLPQAKAEARKRQGFAVRAQFSARALDIVAAHVGWSRVTLSKALAVIDAAKRDRRTYGKLVKQMDLSGKVDRAFREMRRRAGTPCGIFPEGQYTPRSGYFRQTSIHTRGAAS